MAFPKDKDLKPGDIMSALVLRHGVEPVPYLLDAIRERYDMTAQEMDFDLGCDLIIMAVPRGKGEPFVEGLMESIKNDEGGKVID
jgi:hypothetical protein